MYKLLNNKRAKSIGTTKIVTEKKLPNQKICYYYKCLVRVLETFLCFQTAI
jgi:hypothetical protein